MFKIKCFPALALSLFSSVVLAAPGFLIVAPDRGFTGNEAVRDAVVAFAEANPAELVFVTSDGTTERLDRAYDALKNQSAEPVIVMPFYLTGAHPDRSVIATWLENKQAALGRPFGHSAPALAVLEQHLRAMEHPTQTQLILVGHGAHTVAQAKAMQTDLHKLLEAAAQGLKFASLDVVVWPDVDEFGEDDYRKHLAALDSDTGNRSVALPFHLGPHLDAMMGFTPRLQNAAPDGITVLEADVAFGSSVLLWLEREAARYQALDPDSIGVVVHAHGADWQWNEAMRRGAAPLAEDYPVEYAFSMGDPATLAHAVRHLEARGAKAVVIVRVFGMADSFRDGIVRFIGQAWETCQTVAPSHHHGHGAASAPAPVLQTGLPVVTVGGLEDHPLYAKALYQRALDLSEQPKRETIVLVAHGLGYEQGNAHWREVLESIREQMLAMGSDKFRAIKIGLWSEDWPELRQSAVEHVRALVQQANTDSGRALVIPARTLGHGPADEYLEGLDYALGEGFSPHPLFAEWLRTQVKAGIEQIQYDKPSDWRCGN